MSKDYEPRPEHKFSFAFGQWAIAAGSVRRCGTAVDFSCRNCGHAARSRCVGVNLHDNDLVRSMPLLRIATKSFVTSNGHAKKTALSCPWPRSRSFSIQSFATAPLRQTIRTSALMRCRRRCAPWISARTRRENLRVMGGGKAQRQMHAVAR